MYKILVVEDDEALNHTLSYSLSEEGRQIRSARSCRQALALAQTGRFDLALLDINLPDGSGLSLCKEIRSLSPHTRILFLTANDRERDMLLGYAAGGYDYITKPFSLLVLCKKISAILQDLTGQSDLHPTYDDGILHLDFASRCASLEGTPIAFTSREYEALVFLMENPGRILTKRQFMEAIWDVDGNFVDEHTLTTIISRLRSKIENEDHKYIRTTYGLGYQWMGTGTLSQNHPAGGKIRPVSETGRDPA